MNYNPNAKTSLATATFAGTGLLDAETGQINLNSRRLYVHKDGLSYVPAVNAQGKAYGRIQTNAPALLRYQEWLDIDRAVIESSVERMVGLADLRSRGLTYNLGSIGNTISLWETQGDMTEADISMSAITRGEKDTPEFDTQMVPVPIVHKDFSFELRRLVASRNQGASIDVTAASIAGRVVTERSERMLFNGASVTVNGSTIYGYTTHPDRNTVDMDDPWDDPSVDGEDILADVQAMLAAARADLHFGPYVLYIPGEYEGKLDDDYREFDTRTIRQRIMALSGIQEIRVADFLDADNVLLIQMTRSTVDLAIAQDLTTVQWSVMGGMQEEFKVMAVWVPRIKSEFDGRSGIVHLRPA